VVDATVFHQNSAQQAGSNSVKMCAILPGNAFAIDHAQVSFVDRRGFLRFATCALRLHIIGRQAAKFFVNERH